MDERTDGQTDVRNLAGLSRPAKAGVARSNIKTIALDQGASNKPRTYGMVAI